MQYLVMCCLFAAACGSKPDEGTSKESPPTPARVEPQPGAPSKPARLAAPAEDPGSCTLRATGAVTFEQTNPGSRSKVNAWHWVKPEQRDLHAAFVLNCTGKDANLSFVAKQQTVEALPAFGPNKYVFAGRSELGVMAMIRNEPFTHIEGTLDITAFDASHIAGTIALTGKVKDQPVTLTGTFDYRCPGYAGCAN